MKRLTVIVFGWMAMLPTAQSASYECSKASTVIEKNICSSQVLSKLDEELSMEYKKALASDTNKEFLKRQQRDWITATRNACRDNKCLETAYVDRLKQITTLTSNTEKLEAGCDADDKQCVAEAESFARVEATRSTDRFDKIYRSYEKVLTDSERGALKMEQATLAHSDLATCNSRKEVIDRWSCIRWYQDQRSLELDHRFGIYLKNNGNKFQSELFPINLTKANLGVSSASPIYYHLDVDQFELSQDSGGSYAFSFAVVGANGHVCNGAGKAKRNSNLLVRIPDQESDNGTYETAEGRQMQESQNRNCKVEIRLFPNHIEFEGNHECHEYFLCGARASPEGVFFRM